MIENAQIEGTMLGIEDHGILTAFVHCKWRECLHCGFGGYSFDTYNSYSKKREGSAYGAWFIRRVLDTVGVDKWEDLKGRYIRIKTAGWGDGILAIGHITEDKWFEPKKEWEEVERE